MKIVYLLLIVSLSIAPLYSKNFRKTEDIINDILNDKQTEKNTPAKKEAKEDKKGEEKNSLSMTLPDEVLFKTGAELYENRLYADAEKKFKEMLELFPQSKYRDSAGLMMGAIKVNEYKYDEAIAVFSEVKTGSGEYPAAQYRIAESYLFKGEPQKSVEFFRRVYSLYPDNDLADKALLNTGKIYINLKKGDLALEAIINLIKNYGSRKTLDDAFYNLGKIFESDPKLKDPEMARKIYKFFLRKAESGDPKFKNSPLKMRVESDLNYIEKKYFSMEN